MYRKNIDTITRAILVFTILFVISGAFAGVEIWRHVWFGEALHFAEPITKEGAIEKRFIIVLIIGIFQVITLLIKNKKLQLLSLCSAVLGFVFSLRIPFYAVVVEYIGGGIGESREYRVSFWGYVLVISAISFLILQIILHMFLKKQKNESFVF